MFFKPSILADCEAGQEFTPALDGCVDCRQGFYQDDPLAGDCEECAQGETTLFPKSDSEARCDGKVFYLLILFDDKYLTEVNVS